MQEQPNVKGQNKKRGFAAISPERLKQIASAGGVARKKAFDMAHPKRASVPSPNQHQGGANA